MRESGTGGEILNQERTLEDAIARLRAALVEERKKSVALQMELENLKRGSIAMMKYVTNVQQKKHDAEILDVERRLDLGGRRRHDVHAERAELSARKAELEALEAFIAEQYAALERARAGGRFPEGAADKARPRSLDRREREVALMTQELNENFARLTDERALRRSEAEDAFQREMSKVPEMQKLIVERDDAIKRLREEIDLLTSELREIRLKDDLLQRPLTSLPSGEEIDRRFKAWDDELVSLRHRLAARDVEIEEIRRDFETKMRNTSALQRIKYEEEISDLKGRPAGKRPRLFARNRRV